MDGLTWVRCQWDRVAGWALVALSVILVAIAAGQARGALFAADGLSYLMSGGIGGLAAGALGCALLVSAGFHDEWRKLHRVEAALRSGARNGSGATTGSSAAGVAAGLRSQWDRVLGWLLVVAAAVWLALGYRNVAQSIYPPEQVAYLISGGLAALILICAGSMLFLVADWKDDARKLDRIAAASRAGDFTPTSGSRALPLMVAAAVLAIVGVVVVAAGWAKAADAVQLHPAMNGLAIASAGLCVTLLALAAVAFWLRRSLVRRLASVLSVMTPDPDNATRIETIQLDLTDFWTAEGLRRFHRANCPALVSARGERRLVKPDATDQEPCLLCEV